MRKEGWIVFVTQEIIILFLILLYCVQDKEHIVEVFLCSCDSLTNGFEIVFYVALVHSNLVN